MTTAFGHRTYVGFGVESSSYGENVAPSKWLEVVEESLSLEHANAPKPALTNISAVNPVPTKETVSGGFSFHVGDTTAYDKIFEHALGSPVIAGGDYDQTYETQDDGSDQLLTESLTLAVARDATALSNSFKFPGCQITNLTFTQEPEEPLVAAVEVMGQTVINAGSLMAAPTVPTTFFHWGDVDCFFNGTHTGIRRFEVAVENQLADDRFNLGSTKRIGLGRSGPRVVSGSFDVELDDISRYAVFKDLTEGSLTFHYTKGAAGLHIVVPKCFIDGDEPTTSDAGPIVQTMNFTAFFNGTNPDITLGLNHA